MIMLISHRIFNLSFPYLIEFSRIALKGDDFRLKQDDKVTVKCPSVCLRTCDIFLCSKIKSGTC